MMQICENNHKLMSRKSYFCNKIFFLLVKVINATKAFALFGNTFQAEKSANIMQVIRSLADIGGRIIIEHDFAEFLKQIIDLYGVDYSQSASKDICADYAISIGGDGTFLKTAQQVGLKQIPIIGINTGHLGFISDSSPKDIGRMFADVVAGNYKIEKRTLLKGNFTGGDTSAPSYALNEIAVMKHDASSMISINTYVDDCYLSTYQADGLIISTPTGSTGYSLSTGGPIVAPDSKSIILSPIAAHSLSVRPFVLNDDVRITLKVKSRSGNFMVAVDGRSMSVDESTVVEITKAHHTVNIVRSPDHTFFDTLRNKLLWGADKR